MSGIDSREMEIHLTVQLMAYKGSNAPMGGKISLFKK